MRPFDQARVLLGVTGGIASYKAVSLARLLAQAGADVDVVMTRAAREFVGAVTFEGVTGRLVHTELLASGHALDHIRLARAARLVLVAPATADFLSRAAHGRADDLLSAALLATEAPVLLAPAMNDRMWAHPQTARNVASLRQIGYRVIDPDVGPLASGEGSGPGRLPEPDALLAHAARALEHQGLAGARVVVTAGATREAIDPVRFITNHSSGRMGVALAEAAWRRGAEVRLIHGAMQVPVPPGVRSIPVESTADMAEAVSGAMASADVLVMPAAPADFTVAETATRKIKRGAGDVSLLLVPTPDILQGTKPHRRPDALVVGFALETEDLLDNARGKLERKGLDLVVANSAGEVGAGFGVDTNRVTLLARDGAVDALPLMSKRDVADAILDRVEALRHGS